MSLFKKLAFAALAVIAIACLIACFGVVFARANPSAALRGYFRAEGALFEHWPEKWGRASVEGFIVQTAVPAMRRFGILTPARIEVEPGVSFLLDPGDLIGVTILRAGEWQKEVWDSLLPNLSDGAVFLDVGAHIGYFSMKAAPRVGRTGRVLAFEPNPETLKLLRDNVAANHAANITVEPIACTDREQQLTLYASAGFNTGMSSLSRENADITYKEAPRAYSVRGRPIDDVVQDRKLTRVDAVKIDVEGAEVSVLRGAVETLKRFHPKLVVEIVPEQLAGFKTTPDDLIAIVRNAGYNHSRPLNAAGSDWEWTVRDPDRLTSTVRMSDASNSGQIVSGFYPVEQDSLAWTARKFVVALRTPPHASKDGAWLTLRLNVPEESVKKLGAIRLSATVNNMVLTPESFSTAGEHEYRREVPASALMTGTVDAIFSVDKILTRDQTDGRELGLKVRQIELESR
ncbi:MAG: FkbM family methyltransferase [Acidobacteriota bacterium]|nr:FkbM family methyltransferase [Acidobacteriota bacterium]